MLDRTSRGAGGTSGADGGHQGRGRGRRRLLLAGTVVALGLLGAAAAGGLYAGFVIGEHKTDGYGTLREVDRTLQTAFSEPQLSDKAVTQDILTHLIRLDVDVARVPVGRTSFSPISQSGGGMTAFGRHVLLLPYDGVLRAATSSADVHPTRIEVPDIRRAEYQALADDPRFAEYQFNPDYLRYNDLMMVDGPNGPALLVSYTEFHPDEACVTNTLARLDIDPSVTDIDQVEAKASDWAVVYRSQPCLPFKRKYTALEGHMAGGRLAFTPPSTVYMTAGDFHWDGMRSEPDQVLAQDPVAEYGKVMAIDLATGASRIVSMGHRNPQGIAALPDGRVFEVEHGPRGGDEVNLIRDGMNYGWPRESYGTTYWGASALPDSVSFARHDSFEPPAFAWLPSVAVAGVEYVQGFHPDWDGDLLVGALIDKSIWRMRLQGDRIVYGERIEIGSRVRDIHQHTDGRIVLWTDSSEMIFLTGVSRSNTKELLSEFKTREKVSGALVARIETAVERCAECHSFDAGDDAKAPSLARVHGSPIAGTTYAGYSDALASKGGTWTPETLAAFLDDPEGFAPGTGMPDPGIDDPEVIDGLVRYLEFVRRSF